MKKYNVAVVGATGNVGREMLAILHERQFPIAKIIALASSRSAGTEVEFGSSGQMLQVMDLNQYDFAKEKIDLVFSSPGAEVSKIHAPRAAAAGAIVIDNTSYFRMQPDVALVVPEVNRQVLKNYYQKNSSRIIANPNCSTIQLVLALQPLHQAVGIKRVVVATYQSVSGTGKEAMDELFNQTRGIFNQTTIEPEVYPKPIAFNCIPHIDRFLEDGFTKEEWKMSVESKKIMGDNKIALVATCVRVPVFVGHAEAVFVELQKPLSLEQAKEILNNAAGIVLYDRPEPSGYITPIDAAGEDASYISRLRIDPTVANGLAFWCVSDNLRKGAALNAIQIGETLINNNFGGLPQ